MLRLFIFFGVENEQETLRYQIESVINQNLTVLIIQLPALILLCKPESFNKNISNQLFDYTITFVNSQH